MKFVGTICFQGCCWLEKLWQIQYWICTKGECRIRFCKPYRSTSCRPYKRGCFGDALASLLSYSGFEVTREYYINDGGAQVDVLARSIFLRYQEAFGKKVVFEDGTYPGDYLIPIAIALKEKVGDSYLNKSEDEWLPELRNYAVDAMMDLIKSDLDLLGIEMDTFFSEKSLYGSGKIEAALDRLRENGLIYKGVLEPPKGKKDR